MEFQQQIETEEISFNYSPLPEVILRSTDIFSRYCLAYGEGLKRRSMSSMRAAATQEGEEGAP